ncbi:MAG: SLC13 family permease [Ignisphaera sp.]
MKLTKLKLVVILLTLIIVSYVLMTAIKVGDDLFGLTLAENWCKERNLNSNNISITLCINQLNSNTLAFEQALALTLFLFVVIATVIKMEWRVSVALIALSIVVFSALVAPSMLVEKAVEWNLILFLIGSMTLAGILRTMGIFRYLAVQIIKLGKRNPYIFVALIAILSFATAAVLDEVTSIVYVVMIVLELAKVLRVDVKPLIILSVLATNTGSSALPIGNPIGVYLFFTANLPIGMFLRYSFPLALANLVVVLFISFILLRKYIKSLGETLKRYSSKIDVLITHYYTTLERKQSNLVLGLLILLAFVATVSLNDIISSSLTSIAGVYVDPHALLSFIPYMYIVLSLISIRAEEIPQFLEKSVEWSSIIFFISLFILAYTLTFTGVMTKLAYTFIKISTTKTYVLYPLMLLGSAFLSSVLDNLSVIVTYTPIAISMVSMKIGSPLLYFALLFGGIFGGNYTPIGSTANIIAISLAEKKKIKINWVEWLKIALSAATMQLVVSLIWLYLNS